MIVKEFDVTPSTMRKEDPTWRFALGASPVTDGQVVRIATDDGIEGFGYASATPHMGSIQDTLAAELALFRPLVVGRDPHNIEAILLELNRAMHGAPQSKAAIDCALHDLVARALGVPLNVLFGGTVRDQVPILRILAIKTPQEMAAAAQKLIDKGYRYLKIKVHGDVDEDVARVAAIRRQVGDDVHLTIDANQSYSTRTPSPRSTGWRSIASIWSSSRSMPMISKGSRWLPVPCLSRWKQMRQQVRCARYSRWYRSAQWMPSA